MEKITITPAGSAGVDVQENKTAGCPCRFMIVQGHRKIMILHFLFFFFFFGADGAGGGRVRWACFWFEAF